jgi:glycosyltransferase involved in cell wall biosynthesis
VPETLQHLIRLGPDPDVFNPDSQARTAARLALGLGDDEFVVGMASALRPIKRVGDFIDLVEDLGRSDSRIVGLIAGGVVPGEEGYAEDIERRLRQSPLGARLRWLGHLEAMAPFLRALDLFVSTSEYETFGNSVCEAMACRVPVVAYAGGSVAEVIGDAGAVVATGDLRALTARLQRGCPVRRSKPRLSARDGRTQSSGELHQTARCVRCTCPLIGGATPRTAEIAISRA